MGLFFGGKLAVSCAGAERDVWREEPGVNEADQARQRDDEGEGRYWQSGALALESVSLRLALRSTRWWWWWWGGRIEPDL